MVATDVYMEVVSFFCVAELPRSIMATSIVLLPKELLTDVKKTNRGGNVVIKLDMMKAHDKVSCDLRSSLKLIKRVLEEYSVASGQWINPQKSCFLTHPRFPSPRAVLIGQALGFPKRAFPIQYVGCLLYVGRRKNVYFADIYNAVVAHILSWKNQVLSAGGSVVLIKSVLSSMSNHLLAASPPPKGILVALEKLFANFLWGSSDFGTKFHWIRWEDLCRPQEEGVLVCAVLRRSTTHSRLNFGGNLDNSNRYEKSSC
ncbi:uncharacterized protein [Coffea arabica]|uniref:Uncharacterized protein n=1 Tax=Coffea arabica TaxID=13443 RepID=A0A6P6SP55_COFAR|nr:uncharacterized protein LOC113693344 [Coffea arabica]